MAENRDRKSVGMRRLGWRVCIAHGIAKLRRSPRVNEGKARQEKASGSKEMGENHSGEEQEDINRNGNGKNALTR